MEAMCLQSGNRERSTGASFFFFFIQDATAAHGVPCLGWVYLFLRPVWKRLRRHGQTEALRWCQSGQVDSGDQPLQRMKRLSSVEISFFVLVWVSGLFQFDTQNQPVHFP